MMAIRKCEPWWTMNFVFRNFKMTAGIAACFGIVVEVNVVLMDMESERITQILHIECQVSF